MEDDMVADAVLWVIVAAAIAFIACGCHFTRTVEKPSDAKRYDQTLDHRFDRAA